MNNFKVGDRVRVVGSQGKFPASAFVGMAGEIASPGVGEYDWRVAFDVAPHECLFYAAELERIEDDQGAFSRFMERVRGEPVELAHALLDRVRGGAQ